MVQLFTDNMRDHGRKAWLQAIPDLVRTAPTERIEASVNRLGPGGRVLVFALVVLVGVGASVAVGAGAVPLVALAVFAVLAKQPQLFTSLGRGDRAPLRHAVMQSWWAPLAGLLGAAMLLAGVATIFEADNEAGRVVGSTLFFLFGLAMLFGLVRRPFARQAGNSLILLATIPALLFFWLIVPALAAIAVWIGVLRDGFSDQLAAAGTR